MRGDTMTTFIHTADWHLGMTRRYLSPDAQARYSEARIDAVREIRSVIGRLYGDMARTAEDGED